MVPKLAAGSIYAQFISYSESSLLMSWQGAKSECYDGYGARIVAVLPGALGELMMQGMPPLKQCEASGLVQLFGVRAENDNCAQSSAENDMHTVQLRSLHNKVLPTWLDSLWRLAID